MAEPTPMMKQFLEIKERCKDCILFFRLGDFYEMFYEDAEIASKELELVLTGKDCGRRSGHRCAAYRIMPPFHISVVWFQKVTRLQFASSWRIRLRKGNCKARYRPDLYAGYGDG